MSFIVLEGKRARTDLAPLATTEFEERTYDAVTGSAKLRDAILRAKGYSVPKPAPKITAAPVFIERPVRFGRKPRALKVRRPDPRIAHIQALIAGHFKITVDDLTRSGKKHAKPRQIAMYLARKSTTASYPDIGHQFGDRDHTTVMHAFEAVEKRIRELDQDTLRAIVAVHAVIGS